MVSGANNVSFTMDVSSSSVNNTYLLSLTAHWIDGGFVKVFAVLHAQPLQEVHTGEHIAAQIDNMLQNCKISQEKGYVVVSDSASNMIKAMSDSFFVHFNCFAHSAASDQRWTICTENH